MLRRILSIGLTALGAVLVALAIASATAWRSSDAVDATLAVAPDVPFVVTDAGVLDLVAPEVTVVATAPDGAPVTLVLGREGDVAAWLEGAPHLRVTGLVSWTTLRTEVVEGDGATASPTGSDMWVAEVSGAGEATLEWTDPVGRWSVLAATDGTAPAPTLRLVWPRQVSTPFLVPGIVAGSILMLAGLALGGLGYLERREVRRRDAARAERDSATGELPLAADPAPPADLLAPFPAEDDSPTLTRRRLRAMNHETAEPHRPADDGARVDGSPDPSTDAPDGDAREVPDDGGTASPWRRAWGLRARREAAEAAGGGAPEPTSEQEDRR